MSTAASPTPRELVGESVRDGRYAISGVLGEGTQGATLEAIDKLDGSLVAIKRFQVRGARSWKDVELAEREARVLTQLDHALLPKAIDRFEEDGALYLVMERVEGKSLERSEPMRQAEVVGFLRDMDQVLGYLHDHAPPVIHRDIKPSNVIRRPRGEGEARERFVLVDFGSVRDSLKPAGGSTVVGTFGFMAPEQFQGRALPASDIYGAGATALCLLTGQQPEDLPHKGLGIDVREALGKGVDKRLVKALQAMLEPNPDERATRIGPLLAGLDDGPTVAPDSGKRKKAPSRKERKRGKKRDTQTRREEREERRRERHARRDERRREREARRDEEGPSGWLALARALYGPAVVIAMAVARIAVMVATQVIVPVLFSVLAIVFGNSLRKAARAVSSAGERADAAMVRARDYALGRGIAHHREDEEKPRRVRVEEQPRPRRRVESGAGDAIEEAAAELEAAFDEAVREVDDEVRRRRR